MVLQGLFLYVAIAFFFFFLQKLCLTLGTLFGGYGTIGYSLYCSSNSCGVKYVLVVVAVTY